MAQRSRPTITKRQREQARIAKQRPLVVMTPKSLLRLPQAASALADLAEDTRFLPVLPDPGVDEARVTRLVRAGAPEEEAQKEKGNPRRVSGFLKALDGDSAKEPASAAELRLLSATTLLLIVKSTSRSTRMPPENASVSPTVFVIVTELPEIVVLLIVAVDTSLLMCIPPPLASSSTLFGSDAARDPS